MSPHEQSEPDHIPSFEVVNTAYEDIMAHNRRHDGFSNLARGLIAWARDGKELEEAELPDFVEQVDQTVQKGVVEGDMEGELQEVLHADTFMRIGLKIIPGGGMVNGLGERTSTSTLLPVIENTQLYKGYLSTIKPDQIEFGTSQILLPVVLSDLKDTITMCFDPKEREKLPPEIQDVVVEYGEDALRAFLAIEPEYERLGLDAKSLGQRLGNMPEGQGYFLGADATQEQRDKDAAHKAYKQAQASMVTYKALEDYVKYWGRELLPEYIVAERGQYLKNPEEQGFGPAHWHRDGGQRHWPAALEFVKQLDQEDRTRQFGEEVKQGLIRSLDVAIKENKGSEKPDYYDDQSADLSNIRNMLTGQSYSAERLDKYPKGLN